MAPQTKRVVLVIEDDEPLRRMIARFLGVAGYDIRETADGVAGLAMAREQRPDLVLLDLMMPGLDGWQVLQRLKGDAETAGRPVIVLTASVGALLSERALRLGATRYLVKPLDTRILVEAVDQLLHPTPIDEGQSDPGVERSRVFWWPTTRRLTANWSNRRWRWPAVRSAWPPMATRLCTCMSTKAVTCCCSTS